MVTLRESTRGLFWVLQEMHDVSYLGKNAGAEDVSIFHYSDSVLELNNKLMF